MVYKQERKTAGFYIELDKKMLIDPGVGSYLWYVMNFEKIFKVEKLDYILVSHAHIDHCHDIVPYIDRITIGGKRKRNIKLLGSPSVIEGREFGPCIDKKYLSYLADYKIFKENVVYELSDKTTLQVLKNKHTDPWTYSMKFTYKDKNKKIIIGYISDTAYFEELKEFFKETDVLIVNCLRPLNDKHPYHMTAEKTFEIAKEVKPSLLILHHQGYKFKKREIEHLKFFNKKGIKTIFSYEGLEIDLNNLSFRYLLSKPYYYDYLKELFMLESLKKIKNKTLFDYSKSNKREKVIKMLEEVKKQFEDDEIMNLNQTYIDKKRLNN